MTPEITVDRNYVTVQGVTIPRQPSMSPTQWLEFWDVDKDKNLAVDELEAKVEDLADKLKDAEGELSAVQEERDTALEDVKTLQAKIKAVEDAIY